MITYNPVAQMITYNPVAQMNISCPGNLILEFLGFRLWRLMKDIILAGRATSSQSTRAWSYQAFSSYQLSEAYPSLTIYAATIDEHVNEVGYIVPGLGDVGDRAFGT